MYKGRGSVGLAAVIVLSVVLGGCSIIDLRPFGVTTSPSGTDGVVDAAPSVWVEFSEMVVESIVEPFLTVTTAGRSITGDRRWDGNRLIFAPIEAFKPGVRYLLQFVGTVETVKGRSFDENIVVSFYVGSDASPPIISAVSPADGSEVGVSAALSLTFSEAMDAASFSSAFSLSPSAAYVFSWSLDGATVTVAPTGRWTSGTLYDWTVGTGCKSRRGIAVGRRWSGSILVQEDSTLPSVVSTEPAIVSGATVTPLNGGLSAILAGESILMSFSEEVDPSTLQAAFSLSPPLSGALQRVSATDVAFVPSDDWQMGQEYLLVIGTELADLSGNKMPSSYREVFTPAIPEQTVGRIVLTGDLIESPETYLPSQLGNADPYTLDWVGLGTAPNPQVTVTITFTQPYDDTHKPAIATGITVTGVFPSISNPSVTQVSWITDRIVAISVGPFVRSTASQTDYYELTIPSRRDRSMNRNGSFLKDSAALLFESGR